MLIDFDTRFPGRDLALHAHKCPSSLGDRTLPQQGLILDGTVAEARVDHGRWIADCPFDGCYGAEFVSITGCIPFFCNECRNAATGGVPIPVVLPDEKMRGQIDAYLSARPVPATRNWTPGETIKQLRDENREHGVRLP